MCVCVCVCVCVCPREGITILCVYAPQFPICVNRDSENVFPHSACTACAHTHTVSGVNWCKLAISERTFAMISLWILMARNCVLRCCV